MYLCQSTAKLAELYAQTRFPTYYQQSKRRRLKQKYFRLLNQINPLENPLFVYTYSERKKNANKAVLISRVNVCGSTLCLLFLICYLYHFKKVFLDLRLLKSRFSMYERWGGHTPQLLAPKQAVLLDKIFNMCIHFMFKCFCVF